MFLLPSTLLLSLLFFILSFAFPSFPSFPSFSLLFLSCHSSSFPTLLCFSPSSILLLSSLPFQILSTSSFSSLLYPFISFFISSVFTIFLSLIHFSIFPPFFPYTLLIFPPLPSLQLPSSSPYPCIPFFISSLPCHEHLPPSSHLSFSSQPLAYPPSCLPFPLSSSSSSLLSTHFPRSSLSALPRPSFPSSHLPLSGPSFPFSFPSARQGVAIGRYS